MARRIIVSIVLFAASVAIAQSSKPHDGAFENQYVKMSVLPGWTVTSSPPLTKLTRGKYVLTINSIYTHASGIEGGRFGEATSYMPSVTAVRAGVEGPWGTTCSQDRPDQKLVINSKLSLSNLYTNDTKANVNDGCKFPSGKRSAWFGALYVGAGTESEYTITLAYDTSDVNALPLKGSPELTRVLNDVQAMLKTLQLKPPLVISRIEPASARPGEKVTIYGSGFNLPDGNVRPSFVKLRGLEPQQLRISPDGNSLTFTLPTSILVGTCPPGYILKNENCVTEPPDYDSSQDCPRGQVGIRNACVEPIPPGDYQVQVLGSMVQSNRVPFSVLPPTPTPVTISMLYSGHGISPGKTITVRGTGFTVSGNTVRIGNSEVTNVPSSDGHTLTFAAPTPSAAELTTSGAYLKASVQASVENAKGTSNVVGFEYWYPSPNALQWQSGGIRMNDPV